MFTKFLQIILAALAITAASSTLSSVWAQSVNVIEYYNKTLDAYFITGRANEQQTLDATTDFQRTGMTFQAVAAASATTATTRVCRFYISLSSPFTSSHFYGREGIDCENIRSQNLAGFSYEDYDFALAQPSGGVCPTNTTTIFRSFRAGANGKTSNHRYTASAATYAAAANSGYAGEQAAFCATAATDITPVALADCGTFYYPGVRVSYQSLTSNGLPNSWIRLKTDVKTVFNGVEAINVLDRYPSATVAKIMISDAVDTWSDLGTTTQDGAAGNIDTLFNPPTVFPRRMAVGQQIDINRTNAYDPAQTNGSASVRGFVKLVGRESVTVDSGTYTACKFASETTTLFASVNRTSVMRSTTWVAPAVGVVKSSMQETITIGTATTAVTTEVQAVVVQPL